MPETPLASDRRSTRLGGPQEAPKSIREFARIGASCRSPEGDRARKVGLGNLVGFGRRAREISPTTHWVVDIAQGLRVAHPCECRSPHRASLSIGGPVQGQKPIPDARTECRFGLDQRTFTAARPQRARRERSYSPSVFLRCMFSRKRRRSVRHTGNPPIIGWKAHSNGVLRRSYLFRC